MNWLSGNQISVSIKPDACLNKYSTFACVLFSDCCVCFPGVPQTSNSLHTELGWRLPHPDVVNCMHVEWARRICTIDADHLRQTPGAGAASTGVESFAPLFPPPMIREQNGCRIETQPKAKSFPGRLISREVCGEQTTGFVPRSGQISALC